MPSINSSVTVIYTGECLEIVGPACGSVARPSSGNEYAFEFKGSVAGAVEYRISARVIDGGNYGAAIYPVNADGSVDYAVTRRLSVDPGDEVQWRVTAWSATGELLKASEYCTFISDTDVSVECSPIELTLGVDQTLCLEWADIVGDDAVAVRMISTSSRYDSSYSNNARTLCFTGASVGFSSGTYQVEDAAGNINQCSVSIDVVELPTGCVEETLCVPWDEAVVVPIADNDVNPNGLDIFLYRETATGPGYFDWDGSELTWSPDFRQVTADVATVEYSLQSGGHAVGCRCKARVVLKPPPGFGAFDICRAELQASNCGPLKLETVAKVKSVSFPRTFSNISWRSPLTGAQQSVPDGYAPTSQMSFELSNAGLMESSAWLFSTGLPVYLQLSIEPEDASAQVGVIAGWFVVNSFSPSYQARGRKIPASLSVTLSGQLDRNYIF